MDKKIMLKISYFFAILVGLFILAKVANHFVDGASFFFAYSFGEMGVSDYWFHGIYFILCLVVFVVPIFVLVVLTENRIFGYIYLSMVLLLHVMGLLGKFEDTYITNVIVHKILFENGTYHYFTAFLISIFFVNIIFNNR